MKPQIVVDQHIPFATELFSEIGEVHSVPGHKIDNSAVKNANAIIVRSITSVGEQLLRGSKVRFVGTATAGTDHLDTDFLSAADISWASAPGANARSVVEYVMAAISVIAIKRSTTWRDRTLGIVGCGHVGELLSQAAERLGMTVLRNDPPRAGQGGETEFVSLEFLMSHSDIVSVHVPLIRNGAHPTYHLIAEKELSFLKHGSWLIQSSRGSTCDESALIRARRAGVLQALVLDVFENEPLPFQESIVVADIATGHIAGYSVDAKRQGVEMVRTSLCSALGIDVKDSTSSQHPHPRESQGMESHLIAEPQNLQGQSTGPSDLAWLDKVVRQMIDIRQDDERFREVMGCNRSREEASLFDTERKAAFHAYRASYPPRRAFSNYGFPSDSPNQDMFRALGLQPADYWV